MSSKPMPSQPVEPVYHTGSEFSMMTRFDRFVFYLVTVAGSILALTISSLACFKLIPMLIMDFDLVLILLLAIIVLYGMLLLHAI